MSEPRAYSEARLRTIVKMIRPVQLVSDRTWDPEQFHVWAMALHDLPDDAIRKAVALWVTTRLGNWGKPADIRLLAMDVIHGEFPTAEEATERIIFAGQRFGMYEIDKARAYLTEVEWATVRSMGGILTVANSNPDNRSILQSQIGKAYAATVATAKERRARSEALRLERVPTNGEAARLETTPDGPERITLDPSQFATIEKTTKPIKTPVIKSGPEPVTKMPKKREIEREKRRQEKVVKAIIANREKASA